MIHNLTIDCINQAAEQYIVPAKQIIAVLLTEGGNIGQISKNKNGTYDIGPMQINSIWIPFFKQRGISETQLRDNGCVNVQAGAYLLSKSIAKAKNIKSGIGGYHSQNKIHSVPYSQKVERYYLAIENLVA